MGTSCNAQTNNFKAAPAFNLSTISRYLVPNPAYAQDIKNEQQWQLLTNAIQQGQTYITNQSTINYRLTSTGDFEVNGHTRLKVFCKL